jgi:flagellar biosynthesis protein FlhB
MEITTIIVGSLTLVFVIIYSFVTFLLPFYVRRIMTASEQLRNKMAKIDTIEQIQRAQLTALNELIKIQWEIKNQTQASASTNRDSA